MREAVRVGIEVEISCPGEREGSWGGVIVVGVIGYTVVGTLGEGSLVLLTALMQGQKMVRGYVCVHMCMCVCLVVDKKGSDDGVGEEALCCELLCQFCLSVASIHTYVPTYLHTYLLFKSSNSCNSLLQLDLDI